MALFGFGKNKKEKNFSCDEKIVLSQSKLLPIAANIKVLGGGCAKCKELEAATVAAIAELGWNISIEHITDFSVIANYGVMTTPALVVDEKVVSYGKVLNKNEVIDILMKIR